MILGGAYPNDFNPAKCNFSYWNLLKNYRIGANSLVTNTAGMEGNLDDSICF